MCIRKKIFTRYIEILRNYFKFAFSFEQADVAELVDALDLGSSAARRGGSTPSIRTIIKPSSQLVHASQAESEGF